MLMNAYSLQARDICTHAATHMYMHIGSPDYVNILRSIHTHTHIHIHSLTLICTHTCIHTITHTHVSFINTHSIAHTRLLIHTRTSMYEHPQVYTCI